MAVTSLLHRALAPVGEPVPRLAARPHGPSVWGAFRHFPHVSFYRSGTAALAAALQACMKVAPPSAREVLVPGYSAYDLLAAIRFLGLTPVAVELDPDRPWMSRDHLAARLTKRTLAVIPVRLLGLPERLDVIRAAMGEVPVPVIHDCCHCWPGPEAADDLNADYVVFSFRRGKQVTFLTGGALLSNPGRRLPAPEPGQTAPAGFGARMRSGLRRKAYDVLIRPRFYGAVSAWRVRSRGPANPSAPVPPLRRIEALPGHEERWLRRLSVDHPRYGAAWRGIADMVARLPSSGLVDLPRVCGAPGPGLLRYPVLLPNRALRDAGLRALSKRGLGASRLYTVPLANLPEVVSVAAHPGDFPAVRSFCDRLLTLPVHSFVRPGDVARMEATLSSVLETA